MQAMKRSEQQQCIDAFNKRVGRPAPTPVQFPRPPTQQNPATAGTPSLPFLDETCIIYDLHRVGSCKTHAPSLSYRLVRVYGAILLLHPHPSQVSSTAYSIKPKSNRILQNRDWGICVPD